MITTLILIATYIAAASLATYYHEERYEYRTTITTISYLTLTLIAALHIKALLITIALLALLFVPKQFQPVLLAILTPFLEPSLAPPLLVTHAIQTATTLRTYTYTAAATLTLALTALT